MEADKVQKYFFSDRNLSYLAGKLGDALDLDEGRESMMLCRKLIQSQIEDIFKSNKKVLKNKDASAKKILAYLNNKSIEECVDVYNERSSKQSRSSRRGSNGRSGRGHQGRNGGNNNNGGLSGMMEGMGGNYAPIATGNGQFIAANGQMGDKFLLGVNLDNYMQFGDKKQIAGELERRMLERSGDYEGGGGFNPMMGMMGGNMGGMDGNMGGMGGNMGGMDNYNGGMNYNPNMGYGGGMGGRGGPAFDPALFALDGGPKRDQGDFNMMGGGMNGMEGIGGMNGMDGGDSMMGGMGMNGMSGMNPMMQQMYMQQMMQQQQQNMMGGMNGMNMGNSYDDGKMNNNDMMARMNQMQSDRSMDMNSQQRGNFNPQMSPYQNQQQMNPMMMQQMQQMQQMMSGNNFQNFIMGGRVGPDAEIVSKMNEIEREKKSIANKLGLNPQDLENMSAEQIATLVSKANDSDSDDDSNEDHTVDPKKMDTKDLVKMFIEMKKNNINKKKSLHTTTKKTVNKTLEKISGKKQKDSDDSDDNNDSDNSNDSDDSNNSNNNKKQTKKETKKQSVKKSSSKKGTQKKTQKNSESDDDSNSSNNSDSDDENKKVPPKKVQFKKTKQQSKSEKSDESDVSEVEIKKPQPKKTIPKKKTKTINLEFDCSENAEPEFYNDYLVTFADYFRSDKLDLIGIRLKEHTMISTPSINSSCNTLSICILDDEGEKDIQTLEFEDGQYDISELVEIINESFESNGLEFECSLTKDNKITLVSSNDEIFEMDCSNDSIAKFLGFTKLHYAKKTKYVSEKCHIFNANTLYLYAANISPKLPLAIIYPDGRVEQKLSSLPKQIKELEHLIIKVKDAMSECKNDDDTNLHDFCGTSHKITLELDITE
jgi:hypothetical protein